MERRTIATFALVLFPAAGVWAAPQIDVGQIGVPPNTTATFPILVTGGGLVQGLDLYIQIGDGGAVNSGTGTKPIITDVDIVGPGTLFHASNTGQTNAFASDLLWAVSTTTNVNVADKLNADGVLAYVTVNTNGTASGEHYPLLLSGVAKGVFGGAGIDTGFAGVAAEITNGMIVIPEPVSLGLLGLGTLSLLRRRRL